MPSSHHHVAVSVVYLFAYCFIFCLLCHSCLRLSWPEADSDVRIHEQMIDQGTALREDKPAHWERQSRRGVSGYVSLRESQPGPGSPPYGQVLVV